MYMYDLVILEPVYYWHIKIYRQRATIILYMTTKKKLWYRHYVQKPAQGILSTHAHCIPILGYGWFHACD